MFLKMLMNLLQSTISNFNSYEYSISKRWRCCVGFYRLYPSIFAFKRVLTCSMKPGQ